MPAGLRHAIVDGDVVDSWARSEWAAWDGAALSPDELEARLRDAAEGCGALCLLRVTAGSVAIDPRFLQRMPHLGDPGNIHGARAAAYVRHLNDAFSTYGVASSGLLAIYLDDLFVPRCGAPIFAFQKPIGSRSLLLPDVDILTSNYFINEDNKYDDTICFDDKLTKAIFVGSTTGDIHLTKQNIINLKNHRLRSAVYFKNNPYVVFHLPNIVQVNDPEAVALIEGLGVKGRYWSWAEQLGYKFLISMDGNGATCSRVVLALLSNSVLLKYVSQHLLYYFRGMTPWEHYIPIERDIDVNFLIAEYDQNSVMFNRIVRQSQEFAHRYLSRLNVLRYTATLGSLYLEAFGTEACEPERRECHLLDAYAHVSDAGSLWMRPDGWTGGDLISQPIEGFSMLPSGDIPSCELACGVADAPDAPMRYADARHFCGTYGARRPLYGMALMLRAPSSARYRLTYRARFADGVETPDVPSGTELQRDAPLTGFKARLTRLANV